MGSQAILLVGSTVVALLAGEILMRAVLPAARQVFVVQTRTDEERGKFCRYDATLGWAGIPGADAEFDFVDARHHVRQNARGFRGDDVPAARSGKRRIAVLGDSFAWGFGVEEHQLFTHILARDGADAPEVANLGVSGYGTDQELLLWRRLAPELRPDVVLLLVTPYTDVFDVLTTERYGYAKPRFVLDAADGLVLENVPVPRRDDRPWGEPTKTIDVGSAPMLGAASRSALLAAGLLAMARFPPARQSMEGAGWLPARRSGHDWEPALYRKPLEPMAAAGYRVMANLIGTLGEEARAAGVEPVVAYVPTAVQVYDGLRDQFRREHAATAGDLDFDAPDRMMTDLCGVLPVRCIDLLADLRSAARADPYLYYRWNLHWTAAGHRVVAATLARALAAR